jgi:hypothetical protein
MIRGAHVEPESLLKLRVTWTALGFGAIDPLNPTEEPIGTVDVDTDNEIDVDVRKFATSVIGPFMVTDEQEPEHEPDAPVPVHDENE